MNDTPSKIRHLISLICISGLFSFSDIHADVWLNENFNSMTNGQIPVVGGQVIQCNAPSGAIAAVSNSGNVVIRVNKPTTTNASAQFSYTLSDTNVSTARQQGYISFTIQQTPGAAGTSYLQFRIGAADTNTMNSGANGFVDLRFYNNAATKNFQILSPGGSPFTSATTNTISQTDPVTIKVWYNNLSSTMNFTNPSGAVVTMSGNSVMVYANNALMITNSAWVTGQPMVGSVTSGSGTSSSIGKLGFFVTSGNGADFYIDDLYAADTAPAAVSPPVITSPSTANAYLGRAFSYQITGSNSPTSFNAVGLPAGLAINQTTGQITGTPTGSLGTSAVTLTASNSAGTSSDFTLSITVNPTPVVTWNNTGSAWATSSCWTNGAAPVSDWSTDTAVFTGDYGNSNNAVTLVTGRQVSTILFNAGANAYTFDGGDITVGNGITNNSLNAQIFNSKVYGNSNRTWTTVAGGSLVFNGGVDITSAGSSANRTLTLGGGGNFTITGTIGNGGTATNGAITVSSTGLTLFSGANTYNGLTTVNANSTLKLGNALALGTTTNGSTVSSGGVLDLNGQSIDGETLSLSGSSAITSGALHNSSASSAAWSGPISLANSSASVGGAVGDITISGSISGAYTLRKYGSNQLVLSGSNSFAGLGLYGGKVVLSGSGAGVGTLSIISSNPVIKVTDPNGLDAGAILIGPSGSADMGTLDLAAGATNYILNSFGSSTSSGGYMTFTNSGGVAANLIFTNATNFITISSGGNGGKSLYNNSTNLDVVFNGAVDIGSSSNNNSITFTGVGNFKLNGEVFNGGTSYRGIIKNGSGTLILYTNNSYNGATIVQDGMLEVSHPNAIPSANASNSLTVEHGSKLKANTNLTVGPATIAGTLQMALGTSVASLGAVDLSGATINLLGVPSADTYTLVTGTAVTAASTNAPTLSAAITGYSLVMDSTSLKLQKDSASSGFDSWLSNYPSLTGDSAARTADPDGDGMNNQDEYAFGTDPTSAGSRSLTSVDTGTSGQVTLKWLQRDGVTYVVKSSTDLSAGFTATESGASASSPQPGGLASGLTQYEITVNTTGARKFIRVQATVP